MEIMNLITDALTAGAIIALKNTGEKMIGDTYDGLKKLIKKHFETKGNTTGNLIIDEYEKEPIVWKMPLLEAFEKTEIEKEDEIIKMAKKLIEMTNCEQVQIGKFNINAQNIQGVNQVEKIENLTQNFGK